MASIARAPMVNIGAQLLAITCSVSLVLACTTRCEMSSII